jgi:hypothetical protein
MIYFTLDAKPLCLVLLCHVRQLTSSIVFKAKESTALGIVEQCHLVNEFPLAIS